MSPRYATIFPYFDASLEPLPEIGPSQYGMKSDAPFYRALREAGLGPKVAALIRETHGQEAEIGFWIALLSSPPACREVTRPEEQLLGIGRPAEEQLRAAMSRVDEELRREIQRLLEEMAEG